MTETSRWIVTASQTQPLPALKEDLVRLGFKVEQVLETIGVLIGSASTQVAEEARALQGVGDVSLEASLDIGRPDDNTTW